MVKFFSYLSLSLTLVLSVPACNKKTIPTDNQVVQVEDTKSNSEVTPTAEVDPEVTPHSTEADCHGVRKTVQVLKDREGEIIKVGDYYLISIPPGNRRYKPCEMPKEFHQDKLPVVFSGEVLEIFHNERLMGTPFRTTSLKKK